FPNFLQPTVFRKEDSLIFKGYVSCNRLKIFNLDFIPVIFSSKGFTIESPIPGKIFPFTRFYQFSIPVKDRNRRRFKIFQTIQSEGIIVCVIIRSKETWYNNMRKFLGESITPGKISYICSINTTWNRF